MMFYLSLVLLKDPFISNFINARAQFSINICGVDTIPGIWWLHNTYMVNGEDKQMMAKVQQQIRAMGFILPLNSGQYSAQIY